MTASRKRTLMTLFLLFMVCGNDSLEAALSTLRSPLFGRTRGGAVPFFRLRRVPIVRDGLEHAHPVALGVDERDILPHAGDLHRLAENLPARFCHFLD